MGRLQDKVAVVTGASSGIGLATARRFVEEGAQVYITGRRQGELDKAIAAIGRGATAVRGDATDLGHLDELFATVAREQGRLDVLVANAGGVELAALGDVAPDSVERSFALNARAPLFTVQKALPLMRNGGSVILVGSIAGYKGFPAYSAYSAAKAAVRSYARTWTAELRGSGIRVNTLSPGPIDTPLIDAQVAGPEQAAALRAQFTAMIPLGRFGRPEEIADAALFLASDESSFVAGIELSVDGGTGAI